MRAWTARAQVLPTPGEYHYDAPIITCLDGYTGTRFLTLDTTATGLTHAGTRTAANTLFALRCTGIVGKFIQFHVASPFAGIGPQRRERPNTAFQK